jgi:hypothetical protein
MRSVIILIMTILLFGGAVGYSQNIEGIKPVKNKKNILLRPNSRDYGPVHRDNLNQRIDRHRDKSMFINKRPVMRKHMVKPDRQKNINKNQLQRRNQIIMQRRSLRRQ